MGLFGSKKKSSDPDDDFFGFDDNGGSDSFLQDSSGGSISFDDDPPVKKKKKFGSGILGILLAAVIVIAVICGAYLGFSSIMGPGKRECREILNEFEYGCNNLDISAIAECLEPNLSNKIQAAVLVTKVITKQDANELLSMVVEGLGVGLIPDTGDTTLDVSDLLKSISIEPVRFGFPGKTRVVKCKVSFAGISQYVDFTIRKAHGEAYIAKAALAKE